MHLNCWTFCCKRNLMNCFLFLHCLFVITVADEPIWNLERRGSSGHLCWYRDSSKVKFRCDVEVLEYVKDPDEHKIHYNSTNSTADRLTNAAVVCATCVAAIAVTVLLPWFLIGSNWYNHHKNPSVDLYTILTPRFKFLLLILFVLIVLFCSSSSSDVSCFSCFVCFLFISYCQESKIFKEFILL